MRWMKFTNAVNGLTMYCNMARAAAIYPHEKSGAYLDFADGQPVAVTETPEEIIARGQWEVR